jgi:hypothetical protein
MSNTEGESRALDLQNTYTEDIFYCWENLLALNIFENLISDSKQCWGSVCFWQCCGSGSCPYTLDELWILILLSSSKNAPSKSVCVCLHVYFSRSLGFFLQFSILISVADPDPPDPRVFGHPGSGSGSTSQRYGFGYLSTSQRYGFGSGSIPAPDHSIVMQKL